MKVKRVTFIHQVDIDGSKTGTIGFDVGKFKGRLQSIELKSGLVHIKTEQCFVIVPSTNVLQMVPDEA